MDLGEAEEMAAGEVVVEAEDEEDLADVEDSEVVAEVVK